MDSRGRVLVIDGDAGLRSHLAALLQNEGFTLSTAPDGFKALHKIADFEPEVIVLEHHLPVLGFSDLLDRAATLNPTATYVVVAAEPSIGNAVHALQQGALDYLPKPIAVDALIASVDRAVQSARARRQRRNQRAAIPAQAFSSLVGEHSTMQQLRRHIAQIAPSRASVLLEGESGTGKGLVAEAIHRCSTRASGPFIRLSCAALTDTLLESEIYGHEKGAFTGALSRHEGRFKRADGGTLFLDEVSEIPLATQVKLLRFLQERTFERVGGTEELRVDVRVIAATNRDLLSCVHAGTFREDLYYRLNVVPLKLPALRDRASDIPLLAAYFLDRFALQNEKRITGLSTEVLALLSRYSWPGNVRELENVIERAVVLSESELVDKAQLPPNLSSSPPPNAVPPVPGTTLYELERWAILQTLEACEGSTSRAAGLLGISPRKIQYRLREYGGRPRSSPASSSTATPTNFAEENKNP